MTNDTPFMYLGPPGAGLGFALAGVATTACTDAAAVLRELRRLKDERHYSIIFVDEGLAAPVLTEIERLNEDTLPAIILLPNAAEPQHVAQEKMRALVTKAVGSDILKV